MKLIRKALLVITLSFLIFFVSCDKNKACNYPDSSLTAPTNEQDALQDSLTKYNIQADLHPSGLYYKIINPGSGAVVSNLCSQVTATYWGGYFNGSSEFRGFDSSETPIPFTLGQTIIGWQKAIPMIKGGGEINIYIPPSLGYGNKDVPDRNGNVLIPRNSYLVFKVKVTSIK